MPVGTVIKGGDTVARLKLGLREELHIPTDSDGADVLLFEIILKPASKHNPHIVCHEPWPPPPARSLPPPRPSPPPLASPPPPSPPPGFAADDKTCSLGGEMRHSFLRRRGGGALRGRARAVGAGRRRERRLDSGDLEAPEAGVTSQVTVVSPITSAATTPRRRSASSLGR